MLAKRPIHCMSLSLSSQQTVEKSLFLNYFYKHCMHRLMAPLMAQTAGTKISRGEIS